MSNYVNDMWPGSPQEKDSPSTSGSGHSSRLSSRSRSRSSSRSSRSRSRSSGRSSSRSRSRPRRSRRSRSRSRRRHQRFRRYSRSYSRSRSRSRGRRYRDGYYGRPRRYYQSPSPYRSRSRSRSRGRSHSRRSYYAITRGRRYYGFGRTVYPEEHGRWRERSRTRSRSRSRSGTPFRLSEKDRMELLEIAKANAAKALGTTNLVLPASLQAVPTAKDTGRGAKSELSEKQTEDETKSPNEKLSQQRNIAFSSNNSVAKPIQKTANAAAEVTSSGSPKIDKKKSPYGLWIPV